MPTEKPRILVVDDNIANIQVISSLFEKLDYSLNIGMNGQDALDILKEVKPDLILLDVMMPGMDGFTVCRKIKSNPETADIPVIFLTAKANTVDLIAGFEAGGKDYVTKPFNHAELLSRVKTHVELRQKARALENSYQKLEELREKEKQHQEYIENENARLDALVAARTQKLNVANEELKEAAIQLKQLDEAKSEFIKLISHELRTPLHGLGAVEILLFDEFESEEDKDELRKIFRSSYQKLLEIVKHAILLAEIESGVDKDRLDHHPLSDILDNAILVAMDLADSKNVKFDFNPEGSCELTGSKEELCTAIGAILETGVRFSDGKHPVKIQYHDCGKQARITVEARGYSVPDKHLDKIFEVLAIGDAIFPGGDLGLGPAVAKQIINLHGGSIQIENLPSKGIRFIVNLEKSAQ